MSKQLGLEVLWLFTKYIQAPIIRMQEYRGTKRTSTEKQRKGPLPTRGPPYFRLLGLPKELQYAIFDRAIEPWSLNISSHEDICLGDFLCSVDYCTITPRSGHEVFLKCQKTLRKMLDLLLIHPSLKSVIIETIRNKYEGRATWSSCGVNMKAARVPWRVPKIVTKLLTKDTHHVEILGNIPACYVKGLFPAADIIYRVQRAPMYPLPSSSASPLLLAGSYDGLIEVTCHELLVKHWKVGPLNHTHYDMDYTVRFHTHVLPTPDTEILIDLKPSPTGLVVVNRWVDESGTLAPFWMESSNMEVVSSIRTTKQRRRQRWLSALLP